MSQYEKNTVYHPFTIDEAIERTKEYIDAKLDAAILNLFFGLPAKAIGLTEDYESYQCVPSGKPIKTHIIDARLIPSFSLDMGEAWKIIETLRRGWNRKAAACVTLNIDDSVTEPDCSCVVYSPDIKEVKSCANSMPLAICIVAFKLVQLYGSPKWKVR